MPSPFPGMDPYIESPEIWPDFHINLSAAIQGELNQIVQPRYFVELVPHVTYEVIEVAQVRSVYPDVAITQPLPPRSETSGGTAVITPASAESLVPLERPLRLSHLEIRATDTRQLVTVIEILSPANKRRGHQAMDDYQRKRRGLLRSSAHLMEIDLLRGGERPPLEIPVPQAPYYVSLAREERRPRIEVWAIQLAERLPVPPVPLREPDEDVPLDLPVAVATAYQRGGYGSRIDYRQPPPPPPLSPEEAEWVEQLLRERRSER
jgi:hypothetical protein